MDGETKSKFKTAKTKREILEVLGSSLKNFSYYFYKLPPSEQYKVFRISKRKGGFREICAPVSGIKRLQKRLSGILLECYSPKFCVHGYVKSRSIRTNAYIHRRKRLIINADLKDFFDSVNFGRVRGLFRSYPFGFNDEVATVLAQVCCFEGKLPQGASSSPVISNFICYRLDNELISFAKKYKLDYSRYADDITFSTNLKGLPAGVGKIRDNRILLSEQLKSIIQNNGFSINEDKVRYAFKTNRQEVTGLIVNDGINVPRSYVKRIRSMLHSWEKFGIANAAREHFDKFNYKHKNPQYPDLAFKNEITGMINYVGQIKGRGDRVYIALYYRLKRLDSNVRLSIPDDIPAPEGSTVIYCEGKTDRLHLEAALRYFRRLGEFTDLNLYFHPWREDLDINNDYLLQMCRTSPQRKKADRIEIYLFDRDVVKYVKEAVEGDRLYKDWSSNVYSAVLPIPEHRKFSEICIEHFYSDDDLKIKDDKGRRLFTTDEFDSATGNHLTAKNLYYAGSRNKLISKYPRILDYNVKVIGSDENVALSKNNFARNVWNERGEFRNISFDYFRPVFELFRDIIG